MPVQLGSVAPLGFPDFPPALWLGSMRKLGCTAFQAYRNPAAQLSIEEMRRILAATGIRCDSLHGLYDAGLDPSAPDESVRVRSVEVYKSEGTLARALGGALVVVHSSGLRDHEVGEKEHAARLAQLGRSIADLGAFGQEIGIEYAFENLPADHYVGDVRELAALLSAIGAPNTGICFDVGHAHLGSKVSDALRAARGLVRYIHLSDNAGDRDAHLMPTHGTVDFDALAATIAEIGYDGTIMLEVFYSLEQLRDLIDHGFAGKLAAIIDRANAAAGDRG